MFVLTNMRQRRGTKTSIRTKTIIAIWIFGEISQLAVWVGRDAREQMGGMYI